MFEVEGLERALRSLGAVLESRALSYEVLGVGGSSLLLLGVITRPTADLDVVGLADGGTYRKADPLPDPLAGAVADVGLALDLAPDWLNVGPASLMDFELPKGFEDGSPSDGMGAWPSISPDALISSASSSTQRSIKVPEANTSPISRISHLPTTNSCSRRGKVRTLQSLGITIAHDRAVPTVRLRRHGGVTVRRTTFGWQVGWQSFDGATSGDAPTASQLSG